MRGGEASVPVLSELAKEFDESGQQEPKCGHGTEEGLGSSNLSRF